MAGYDLPDRGEILGCNAMGGPLGVPMPRPEE
jgi:hypothetical protein